MTDTITMDYEDWAYFLSRINFGASAMDARAIQIMNTVRRDRP